jgi:type II secretory pathway pseudopilin PulG
MVEIAISLAIIGFALVAIVGVLPLGMNVQKENREETIINQDLTVFMEAIRSGAQGYDNLTNYVFAITNYWTRYDNWLPGTSDYDGYNRTGSRVTSFTPGPNGFALTNGQRIVGLLCRPKYEPVGEAFVGKRPDDGSFRSNHIVAFVSAASGGAAEKFPQDNQTIRDAAFSYRMICELVYQPLDTNTVNYLLPGLSTNQVTARSNHWLFAKNLEANLRDLRLTFRWPLLPNYQAGNGRLSFRTMIGGKPNVISDPYQSQHRLRFFASSTYTNAP